MRQLVSHVSTDYAAFAVTVILVLIVTLIYLFMVSISNVLDVVFNVRARPSCKLSCSRDSLFITIQI